MDFALPEHLRGVLDEIDAFISAEIAPLEAEHLQYFDRRREYARTDWENGGVPRREWEELLDEMRARDANAATDSIVKPYDFGLLAQRLNALLKQ